MPSISEILVQDDFGRIVSDLCVDTIENREPREYLEEYNGKRNRRTTSVGFREPKTVAVYSETEEELNPQTGKMEPKRLEDKTVPVAKIVTNIPKKIVRTAAAFLFGSCRGGGLHPLASAGVNCADAEYGYMCRRFTISFFRALPRKMTRPRNVMTLTIRQMTHGRLWASSLPE